jgi:hypothetical protein
MSRDLAVQLITKKRSLYEKRHALAIEELAIEEALAHCPLEECESYEAKRFEVNTKQLVIDAALQRSHLFGQRYANSFTPSLCISCFVDHNRESFMLEVESDRGPGTRQFWCLMCKHVARVSPL